MEKFSLIRKKVQRTRGISLGRIFSFFKKNILLKPFFPLFSRTKLGNSLPSNPTRKMRKPS